MAQAGKPTNFLDPSNQGPRGSDRHPDAKTSSSQRQITYIVNDYYALAGRQRHAHGLTRSAAPPRGLHSSPSRAAVVLGDGSRQTVYDAQYTQATNPAADRGGLKPVEQNIKNA